MSQIIETTTTRSIESPEFIYTENDAKELDRIYNESFENNSGYKKTFEEIEMDY